MPDGLDRVFLPTVLEFPKLQGGDRAFSCLFAQTLPDMAALRQNWAVDKIWEPKMTAADRAQGVKGWQKAVSRTLDWEVPE